MSADVIADYPADHANPEHPDASCSSAAFFLDPLAPLLFRNGQTIGDAGALGATAIHTFPLPGTVAGAVRSAFLSRMGVDEKDLGHGPARQLLMQGILIVGPFPARLCASDEVDAAQILLPKPADCVYLKQNGSLEVNALVPRAIPDGMGCDIPNGLWPLFLTSCDKSKPESGPAWWTLNEICAWMLGMPSIFGADSHNRGPMVDVRTHVTIEDDLKVAADGQLYATGGLDFSGRLTGQSATHGLVTWVSATIKQSKNDGYSNNSNAGIIHRVRELDGWFSKIGADGRGVRFHALNWKADAVDALRQHEGFGALYEELNKVKQGDVVRLALLTPAFFRHNGWYPDGLFGEEQVEQQGVHKHNRRAGVLRGQIPSLKGWDFRLIAAAVNRWQPYAGAMMTKKTDLMKRFSGRGRYGDQKGEAPHFGKPLKRLVPAGSVYWLKVETKGEGSLADAMMKSVCREEYGRDGFGIAMFGLAPDVDKEQLAGRGHK